MTKEKKLGVFVVDMPLLDTRQGRDLTGTLIADIVLDLLSYVAQTKREFIKQRLTEGIAATKGLVFVLVRLGKRNRMFGSTMTGSTTRG